MKELRLSHLVLMQRPLVLTDFPEFARCGLVPSEQMRELAIAEQLMFRSAQHCPVVFADNVASYYHASEQLAWGGDDFPNCAPPWPIFFVEWRQPSFTIRANAETGKPERIEHPSAVTKTYGGVFCLGMPFAAAGELFGLHKSKRVEVQKFILNYEEAAQWCLFASLWLGSGGRAIFTGERMWLAVDPAGTYLGSLCVPGALAASCGKDYDPFSNFHEFCLTLSFLHCKNVGVSDSYADLAPATKRLQKEYYRGICFKVLNIEPMRQVLQTEGRSESEGLIKALHICRGHFRHYREDSKGLFGRLHGTFWIPQHVRGNEKVGVVTKDYRIK